MSPYLTVALVALALVLVALVRACRDLWRAEAAICRVRATCDEIDRRARMSGASVAAVRVALGFTESIRGALDGAP